MSPSRRQSASEKTGGRPVRRLWVRSVSVLLLFVLTFSKVPPVSAHGATATGGLSQGHGVLLGFSGIGVLVGAAALKRTGRVSPTVALYGVFVGLTATALGAVIFEGLSPDLTYSANSMPFPRSWYQPVGLAMGLSITVVSFAIGWLRWPTRPRYTFLGILLGVWISYPYLLRGPASASHPLGYAIVLATPLLVGYVVWKDTGNVLRAVFRDRIVRRFGIGVGIVMALFFVSVTGYLSFFPEEGFPHEVTIVVVPAIYQLVLWPTLEIAIPHIPFFLAVSPGQVILVGTLSTLVGLNAALIARHWRVEERAGLTEGTAGSAAIVGSCTCGCCGPLVAKIAVLAAGPALAAPLYWVFVDSASPLSSLFVVGSLLLFAGSLIYTVESTRQPERSIATASPD